MDWGGELLRGRERADGYILFPQDEAYIWDFRLGHMPKDPDFPVRS